MWLDHVFQNQLLAILMKQLIGPSRFLVVEINTASELDNLHLQIQCFHSSFSVRVFNLLQRKDLSLEMSTVSNYVLRTMCEKGLTMFPTFGIWKSMAKCIEKKFAGFKMSAHLS